MSGLPTDYLRLRVRLSVASCIRLFSLSDECILDLLKRRKEAEDWGIPDEWFGSDA